MTDFFDSLKGNRQGSLSHLINRRSAAVQKLNCGAFFSFRRFADHRPSSSAR